MHATVAHAEARAQTYMTCNDTIMEDMKGTATQLQTAHFPEARPYMDPLRVATIAPDEPPDRALEPRQSSGGPKMTRSTALREPTACNTRIGLHVAQS